MKKIIAGLLIVGWLFYAYLVHPPADSATDPANYITADAKPYTSIKQEVGGFPGRVRVHYEIISPDASNHEQFAQTAMRAAIDKWRETQAQVVYVMLNPSPNLIGTGDAYAIARYAPDGGGDSGDEGWMWSVEAMSRPYTEKEIDVAELWFSNREQYLEDDGILANEPELKAFIAEELGILEDEVRLPYRSRKDYVPLLAE